MAFYECTLVMKHDLSATEVQELTKEFQSIITTYKGKLIKEEQWGLRQLAYKINKIGKAHYVMLGVDAPHAAIVELERNCRINENIIRYLTVRVETMDSNKPSVMLRAKQGDYAEDAA